MVKIIKRGFDINNDHFDVDDFRYKVLPWIDNIRFDVNYPISYDINTLIQTSENEPISIDKKFIRKTFILKDCSPIPDDEQTKLPTHFPGLFLYKRNIYLVDKYDTYTEYEIKLMIKEHFYKHNEKFNKLKKEIQLFESVETQIEKSSREPIPEQVRFSVWRRDEGKCVQCGSNKDLEFDHIIPVSKGGSNTERNLQLLCEKCNREKSAKI